MRRGPKRNLLVLVHSNRNGHHALSFADGMRYIIARFASLLGEDPVAMNRALVDAEMGERGYQPPDLIPVCWSSALQPWEKEFVRLRRAYRVRVKRSTDTDDAQVGRRKGRPTKEQLSWH